MGYLGTLDPLATGVLAVFIGKGTKLIPYFEESQKTYIVKAGLGKRSDTYDVTGEIEVLSNVEYPKKEIFTEVVQSFLGDQLQIQPAFSALKFEGKRAYEHAREGKTIDLGKRQVTFHEIKILEDQLPSFSLEVTCSSGTYIRSLIHELGEKLGSGALMTELRRTQAGPFLIDESVHLENFRKEDCLYLEEFLEKYSKNNAGLMRDKSYLLRKLQV